MNLLLITNLLTGAIGLTLLWVAWKLFRQSLRSLRETILMTVFFFSGFLLLLLAFMEAPSGYLQAMQTSAVPEPIFQGTEEDVQEIISSAYKAGQESARKEQVRRIKELVSISLPPDAPVPEAEPEPPVPIIPSRERTLPDGMVVTPITLCARLESLHGKSGGPDADGCYAVGCDEGYALPMEQIDGSWQICRAHNRLPRLGDCYFVQDSDGTERSMRRTNNTWKSGVCR